MLKEDLPVVRRVAVVAVLGPDPGAVLVVVSVAVLDWLQRVPVEDARAAAVAPCVVDASVRIRATPEVRQERAPMIACCVSDAVRCKELRG